MTTPFDLPTVLVAAQSAYLQRVSDILAAYAAGKPWPPSIEDRLGCIGVVPAIGGDGYTSPPVPAPPPAPPAIVWKPLAPGSNLTLLGSSWSVQAGTPDSVSISEDGTQLAFKAKSGEHASFDPDRKIRAEIGNAKTYAKGEPISLKGTIWIDPATSIATSEWCSIAQIHQADTRRADGVPVAASPTFALGLVLKDGKPMLQVRAETGKGIPAPNVFSPERELGRAPISFGVEHAFEFTVIDGHGGDGSVKVSLDGNVVVDFAGPVGYEYVDLLASAYLVRGLPQPTGSYVKVGIYAGLGSDTLVNGVKVSLPPEGVVVGYRFKFAP